MCFLQIPCKEATSCSTFKIIGEVLDDQFKLLFLSLAHEGAGMQMKPNIEIRR